MSQYTGVKCPVCEKKFREDDDIVVCPICGAPYHRSCYKQNKTCVFEELHNIGKEWRNPDLETAARPSGNIQKCPRCDGDNSPQAIFCQICGTRLSDAPPPYGQQPFGQQTPSGKPEGQTGPIWPPPINGARLHNPYETVPHGTIIGGELAEDIVSFVGPGSEYYLPRFQAISDGRGMIFASLSAFFFSFLYYFYRKMYFVGAILLSLFVICVVGPYLMWLYEYMPSFLYQMGITPEITLNTAAAQYVDRIYNFGFMFFLIVNMLLSFRSVRMYYKHVISSIGKMKSALHGEKDPEKYHYTLYKRGRVTWLVPLVIGVVLCVLFLACYTVMVVYFAPPGTFF